MAKEGQRRELGDWVEVAGAALARRALYTLATFALVLGASASLAACDLAPQDPPGCTTISCSSPAASAPDDTGDQGVDAPGDV
jgi:hypothetical protein